MIGGSLGLVAAGAVGHWNDGALVWVDRLLNHPFVFGVVAAIGFTTGCALLVPRLWLRSMLIVSGVLVAGFWTMAGWYVHVMWAEPERLSVAAPDGSGSSYEVVVRDSSDGVIDYAWVLSIRQTGSLVAREWYVGCMSDDAPWNAFKGVTWEDRGRLVVAAHGGKTFTVAVDPTSGRPLDPERSPWTC